MGLGFFGIGIFWDFLGFFGIFLISKLGLGFLGFLGCFGFLGFIGFSLYFLNLKLVLGFFLFFDDYLWKYSQCRVLASA